MASNKALLLRTSAIFLNSELAQLSIMGTRGHYTTSAAHVWVLPTSALWEANDSPLHDQSTLYLRMICFSSFI